MLDEVFNLLINTKVGLWLLCFITVLFSIGFLLYVIHSRNQTKLLMQIKQNEYRKGLREKEAMFELKEKAIKEMCEQRVGTARSELETARAETKTQIEQMKQECVDAIQKERERIETDKEQLTQKPEKELLVDAVFALSGLGSKVDRLEKKYIEQLEKLIIRQSEILDNLSNAVRLVKDEHDDLQKRVNSKLEDLESSIGSIQRGVDEAREKVNDLEWSVGSNSSALSGLESSIESKLSGLESSISSVESSVGDIKFQSNMY